MVGDDQLAREHAVEDQQADVVGGGAGEAGDVPGSDGQPVRADDELALGVGAPAVGEQRPEIRVGLQEPDRLRRSDACVCYPRHTSPYPAAAA